MKGIYNHIKNYFEYQLGDIVYFKVDQDCVPYMITGIEINMSGIMYICSNKGENLHAFPKEITYEKKVFV